jgi:hypothetical protein
LGKRGWAAGEIYRPDLRRAQIALRLLFWS